MSHAAVVGSPGKPGPGGEPPGAGSPAPRLPALRHQLRPCSWMPRLSPPLHSTLWPQPCHRAVCPEHFSGAEGHSGNFRCVFSVWRLVSSLSAVDS